MKLWATIQKDIRILFRDKTGLLLMFAMPVLLVLVVTGIQNNSFDVTHKSTLSIIVWNKDTGSISREFVDALDSTGLFHLSFYRNINEEKLRNDILKKNMAGSIIINNGFSQQILATSKQTAGRALQSFGLESDTTGTAFSTNKNHLKFYYNPALQQSLKASVEGSVLSALQIIQSQEVLKQLYFAINEAPLPDSLKKQLLKSDIGLEAIPLTSNGQATNLNATQHNVPSWTIFAMFFIVMSLGASIVREKLSGAFIRLRTLPTNYYISLLSKQITYLTVTFIQAVLIFTIGALVFPLIGLPALQLPGDIGGLILVTLACGWCAVSYALCVGVFAKTQEQASAFGAVSIIILSLIGGLMVPDFIMPQGFKSLSSLSPLHWCLQAYYGLFLQNGKLGNVAMYILFIIIIAVVLQLIVLLQLKRKRFI
ncbi:ABC transporter permease [Parafilimonas terrae]|uniref:ABC-2 type transport system permease protein n=1 Tax=Parafilimonas terrae TaxID=1465490 RepID=A0A1I5XY65_9BACT|nr:ABC transporter permease [Parafilimonas terrae]SFQ36922.1 ABC-2 type transport system permease protein [Parafilimonas terrae]